MYKHEIKKLTKMLIMLKRMIIHNVNGSNRRHEYWELYDHIDSLLEKCQHDQIRAEAAMRAVARWLER